MPCRPNFLLPVHVLSRLFRGLILKGLKKAHADGRLKFFNGHRALADKTAFNAYLKPLYKTNWAIHAKEPFAGPKAVLAYLSRYTHRVAIANSRLIRALFDLMKSAPARSPSQPPDMVGILPVVGRGSGLVPFDRKML